MKKSIEFLNSIIVLYWTKNFPNSEPKRFPNSGPNIFLNLLTDEHKK